MRKLLSVFISLLLMCSTAFANLELGDMTLKPDVDNFINGSIDVMGDSNIPQEKRVIVKLGSITDYYRYDAVYSADAAALRFHLANDAEGMPIIKARSQRAIASSQFKAIVKLIIDGEISYGLYVIQLQDEPVITPNLLNLSYDSAPVLQPVINDQAEISSVTEQPIVEEIDEEVSVETTPMLETYIVVKGDSISAIAMVLYESYPQYANWHSLMNVLVEMNPHAFVNNNINLLKLGAELTLPPSSEIKTTDKYWVLAGDNVNSIAGKLLPDYPLVPESNVKVIADQLIAQNNDVFVDNNPDQLPIGVYLVKPSTEMVVDNLPVEKDLDHHYQVQAGDTLSSIAITLRSRYQQFSNWYDLMNVLVETNAELFEGREHRHLITGEWLKLPAIDVAAPSKDKAMEGLYKVAKAESLGEIAMRLKASYPQHHHWRSLMLEIHAMNPDAFVDGDIDKLKYGAYLKLPQQ